MQTTKQDKNKPTNGNDTCWLLSHTECVFDRMESDKFNWVFTEIEQNVYV